MKTTLQLKLGITLAGVLALIVLPARADTFGSGANTFTIGFVDIGNPGNPKDTGAGGGISSSPYGGMSYTYRMGTYEVAQDTITKATASGMTNVTAGAWTGSKPAAYVNWYECAAFVNWLNTSTGHHAAYDLAWTGSTWTMNLWSSEQAWQVGGENLYRHKDAYYFLPSEDEWYKAAFHKNDGVTANYWDYATGSNSLPASVRTGMSADTAVYSLDVNEPGIGPAAVDNDGGLSSYGTRGQDGNVNEWLESAFYGANDLPSEPRVFRGGGWGSGGFSLRSSERYGVNPDASSNDDFGFRVASILGPFNADTDGDGILDIYETGTGVYVSPTNTGTSPTNPDSDGDGLTDGQEVNTYHSNPNVKDTDGDGFEDGFEVSTGFNPTSAASTPDALSSIRTAAEYRFNAALGISYRIEASTDLANWTTIETNIIGAGGVMTRFYSIEGQPRRFFRSRRN